MICNYLSKYRTDEFLRKGIPFFIGMLFYISINAQSNIDTNNLKSGKPIYANDSITLKNSIGIKLFGPTGLTYKHYLKHTAFEINAGLGAARNTFWGSSKTMDVNFYYRNRLSKNGYLQWYTGGGIQGWYLIYHNNSKDKYKALGVDIKIGIEKFSKRSGFAWSIDGGFYHKLISEGTSLGNMIFFPQLSFALKYRF